MPGRCWSTPLRTGKRPGVAWAPVPVLLAGRANVNRGRACEEPLQGAAGNRSAWRHPRCQSDDRLCLGGRASSDCLRSCHGDRQAGGREQAAEEIALSYWNARNDFALLVRLPACSTPCSILPRTRQRRPVILADSADNPTGGGVGDRADVLKALLARGFDGALVAGITDPPAVEACFAAGQGGKDQAGHRRQRSTRRALLPT